MKAGISSQLLTGQPIPLLEICIGKLKNGIWGFPDCGMLEKQKSVHV